jgi:hypothetical protein
MILEFLFWVFIAAFIGVFVLGLCIGQYFGRQDRDLGRLPAGEHPYPEQDAPDPAPDAWDRWLEETVSAKRLADTGELQRLYSKPYPLTRVAGTMDLAAMAERGDLAELAAQVAAHKKEIDQA